MSMISAIITPNFKYPDAVGEARNMETAQNSLSPPVQTRTRSRLQTYPTPGGDTLAT